MIPLPFPIGTLNSENMEYRTLGKTGLQVSVEDFDFSAERAVSSIDESLQRLNYS